MRTDGGGTVPRLSPFPAAVPEEVLCSACLSLYAVGQVRDRGGVPAQHDGERMDETCQLSQLLVRRRVCWGGGGGLVSHVVRARLLGRGFALDTERFPRDITSFEASLQAVWLSSPSESLI